MSKASGSEVDSALRTDFAFKENDKFDPFRTFYPSMPKIDIPKMRKELL